MIAGGGGNSSAKYNAVRRGLPSLLLMGVGIDWDCSSCRLAPRQVRAAILLLVAACACFNSWAGALTLGVVAGPGALAALSAGAFARLALFCLVIGLLVFSIARAMLRGARAEQAVLEERAAVAAAQATVAQAANASSDASVLRAAPLVQRYARSATVDDAARKAGDATAAEPEPSSELRQQLQLPGQPRGPRQPQRRLSHCDDDEDGKPTVTPRLPAASGDDGKDAPLSFVRMTSRRRGPGGGGAGKRGRKSSAVAGSARAHALEVDGAASEPSPVSAAAEGTCSSAPATTHAQIDELVAPASPGIAARRGLDVFNPSRSSIRAPEEHQQQQPHHHSHLMHRHHRAAHARLRPTAPNAAEPALARTLIAAPVSDTADTASTAERSGPDHAGGSAASFHPWSTNPTRRGDISREAPE